MDINNRLSKLLLLQDCVIIPNLGGFITNYRSAQTAVRGDKFIPPSREVVFNAKLSKNDGLLVNFVAEETGCSYFEALNEVRLFSEKCLSSLSRGEKVYFNQIGFLFLDREQNIQFEPEETVTLLPDAYGLSPFEFNEIGQKVHPLRRTQRKDHNVVHRVTWKWVAAGIVLAAGLSAVPIYSCYNSHFEFSSLISSSLFKNDTIKKSIEAKNTTYLLSGRKSHENSKVTASAGTMEKPEDGKALYGKGLPSEQRDGKEELKNNSEKSTISETGKKDSEASILVKGEQDKNTHITTEKGKSKKRIIKNKSQEDQLLNKTGTTLLKEGKNPVHSNEIKLAKNRLGYRKNLVHSGQRYNLIVGCFKNVTYARYYKKLLVRYGYSPKIFPKDHTTSYYRISLNSYKNARMASNAMRTYKKRMPRGIAWILVR